jgi:hypothetical protein
MDRTQDFLNLILATIQRHIEGDDGKKIIQTTNFKQKDEYTREAYRIVHSQKFC